MISAISRGVARVIGEVLGAHYFSHRRIETLCYESGLTGDVPQGNCSDKITSWICREADAKPSEVVGIVGRLLCEFMDADHESHEKGKQRIEQILALAGLSYSRGGMVFGAAVSIPANTTARVG